MTDGGLYLSDSGEEFKRFNSLDGHGLKMLKASGVELAIITGRTSRCVELRAKNLGITHVYQGVEKKWDAMRALLAQLNLAPENAAFMGDDVVDLPAMSHVGLAFSVPGAPQIVRDRAHYVTQRNGRTRRGTGSVRIVDGGARHAGSTTGALPNGRRGDNASRNDMKPKQIPLRRVPGQKIFGFAPPPFTKWACSPLCLAEVLAPSGCKRGSWGDL